MRTLAFLTLLAALVGCGNAHRNNHVTVWIAPEHPEFPREAFLDGCRYWDGFGETCDLVKYANDADITVSFTEDDCSSVLAWDQNNPTDWSQIVVCAQQYKNLTGDALAQNLKVTFAHEVGHALGLEHVPPGCDLSSFLWEQQNVDPNLQIRRHSNGQIICGKAVMNPRLDNTLNAITYEDELDFDVRNRDWAVLNPVGPVLGEPDPPDAGTADGGGQ